MTSWVHSQGVFFYVKFWHEMDGLQSKSERQAGKGTYVLGFGGHTATIKNGILYDAWDSSSLVPQYYWYRRY